MKRSSKAGKTALTSRRLHAAGQKAAGAKPDTQQSITTVALVGYFEGTDAMNPTLVLAFELIRAAAVDLAHFGHRDASSDLLRAAGKLGANINVEGIEGQGGDYPAIVPLLPSGIEASAPHITWNDKPMKAGEATVLLYTRLLEQMRLSGDSRKALLDDHAFYMPRIVKSS